MKTWKKLLTLLSAVTCAFTFTLAACKDDESGNDEPTPPAPAPETPSDYIFPEDDDPIQKLSYKGGNGTRFDPFECQEGYYSIRLPKNRETFFSFSVSKPGIYAFYSMDAAENIVMKQYDYVGAELDNSNSLFTDAVVLGEEYAEHAGVVYATVSCGERYFNAAWRGTFSLHSVAETTADFRFVRIGDPIAEPEYLTTKIAPTEILGKADVPENKTAIVVPYSTEFFYDEDYEIEVTPFTGGNKVKAKGFYRMGNEDNPGAVIYAAISKNATRYLGDASFAIIQYKGNNLSVYTGKNEKGDYLINDYVDFIMNDGGVEGGTANTTMACYKNAENADGLYPVNQELYEFLNLYTATNNPSGTADDSKYWLAPCYYYADVVLGSHDYPNSLNTTGTTTVNVPEYSTVYYNVKWTTLVNEVTGTTITQGYYKLTCDTPNAVVFFDGRNYFVNELGEVSITFETNAVDGRTFGVKYYDGSATSGDVTFTLSPAPAGNLNNPLVITNSTATLTTQEWYTMDYGVEYSAHYEYTATESGTLIVSTTTTTDELTILVNGVELTVATNAEIDLDVDDSVSIVIEGSTSGQSATIALNFQAK
jgi:hypothetical protein